MQKNLINEQQMAELSKISFLVGDINKIKDIGNVPSKKPFDEEIMEFLNDLSKDIMADKIAKTYPDVITLAFWMRKSSITKLKERFLNDSENIHLGRGILFHIAPSNVPVNYAYSLVSGLITGNINIVRIPSKDFPQVDIINKALRDTLNSHTNLKEYVYLVRYGRDKAINDIFSSISDVRVVWGGDNTIDELRKSPIQPRSGEVTFADRYSLAIIDSDTYLSLTDKKKFSEDFYNDTYLTDQNACTSPRIVVWTGNSISEAKELFWTNLHNLVKRKYTFQSIMGVNKMTSSYIFAASHRGVKIIPHIDNYLVRVEVTGVDDEIMDYKDNSGYFFEYDCSNLIELRELCNNTHCQTIGFLGDKKDVIPLLESGLKGVDRVVPIGKTMDFDLIWDGYNLFERFTRTISLNI